MTPAARVLELAVLKFADLTARLIAAEVAKLTAAERAFYDREREKRGGCELDILAELEARRLDR